MTKVSSGSESMSIGVGAVQALLRTLRFGADQPLILLAHCNYRRVRERILEQVRLSFRLREIELSPSAETLYTTLKAELGQDQDHPQALSIIGLESIRHLEILLESANRTRDALEEFNCPIVLWINDRVFRSIMDHAFDLYSVVTTLQFEAETEELLELIEESLTHLFDDLMDQGVGIFVTGEEILGSVGLFEIETAWRELQEHQVEIEPWMSACYEFLLGRVADQSMESARDHYLHSLQIWPEGYFLEWHGIVLFSLGIWWRNRGARIWQEEREAYRRAQECFQQAIEVFDRAGRKDGVGRFINALGEVLLQIAQRDPSEEVDQAVEILEEVAQRSVELNQGDPLRLSEAEGFLAAVALHDEQWDQAQQLASRCLQRIEGENVFGEWVQSFHGAWYQFIGAQALIGSGQVKLGIEALERARDRLRPGDDPELVLRILGTLESQYSRIGNFVEAFRSWQDAEVVRYQFGYRAFIGVGRLKPRLQINNPALPPPDLNYGAVTGRDPIVDRLEERIERDDTRLTVVYGPSGVGKSSVIEAGLIPRLEKKSVKARSVVSVVMRTYTHWIKELDRVLDQVLPPTCSFDSDGIFCRLEQAVDRKQLVVLILDQFEEFFFASEEDPDCKRDLYQFLKRCLEKEFIYVILSLREDYLQYVLEWDRVAEIRIDVLSKNCRVYVGDLSLSEAVNLVDRLTEGTRVQLDPDLVQVLVQDLGGSLQQVRPVQVQMVGAQLLRDLELRSADLYTQLGSKPQHRLEDRYLAEVTDRCGDESERRMAKLILYVLTDDRNTRPLKTQAEIAKQVKDLDPRARLECLPQVMEILEYSGLMIRSGSAEIRYQLVHDYLAKCVRRDYRQGLLVELQEMREKEQQLQKRLRIFGRRVMVASVIASVFFAGVATVAVRERQRAESREIGALGLSAAGLFDSGDQLHAMTVALETVQRAERSGTIDPEDRDQAVEALRKIVYQNQLENQFEGGAPILSISISPDGQILASGSWDTTVKLWSLEGEELASLEGHRNSVTSMSFSPDGQILASASGDNTVKLWNLEGEELVTLAGHRNVVTSVSFSPDGQTLASGSWDNTVKLWSLEGEELAILEGHRNSVTSVSFSPDGQTLASASRDNTVKLWSLEGEELAILEGHRNSVTSVSFSSDGQTLASGSWDNTVKLWSLEGEELVTLEGHRNSVTSVSFSPDGQTLASASGDNTVKLWSLEGEELVTLAGHRNSVNSLSFSSDGQILASGSGDTTVKLWNLQGEELATLAGHRNSVNSLSFSPDGQLLVSGSGDTTVKLWSLAGEKLATLAGHHNSVYSVSFSPDGQTLASGSADNTMKLWSLEGEELATLVGHRNDIHSVSFNPGGQTLASGSGDTTVKLWSPEGEELATLAGHRNVVTSVSFSPDGQTLVSGSGDNTVKLWSLEGEELITLAGHSNAVNSVSFSPDGQTLASGNADNTVKLWDLEGEELATLVGHSNLVTSVSFSPGRQILASGSWDNTVKLWSLEGEELATLEGHRNAVNSVSFSPYGQILASASADNTIKLWSLPQILDPQLLLSRGCHRIKNYLTYNSTIQDRTLCNDVSPDRFAEGIALARSGDLTQAIDRFQEVQDLYPIIQDPEVYARFHATEALEYRYVTLLLSGRSREAIEILERWQEIDPEFKPNAADWNYVCWQGGVYNRGSEALPACDRAVDLAPDNPKIQDSRGLVRALTGDRQGAIADFETLIPWIDEYLVANPDLPEPDRQRWETTRQKRQEWIAALEQGENPFDWEEFRYLQRE